MPASRCPASAAELSTAAIATVGADLAHVRSDITTALLFPISSVSAALPPRAGQQLPERPGHPFHSVGSRMAEETSWVPGTYIGGQPQFLEELTWHRDV